ncbi:hypothetical protein ACK6D9_12200 [Hoeflea sp. Naph1]|uniref:hypothetical protein n=1 Tax=Hoeflea sp. Naph1 TaxID=3388653 RepID=UPI00398F99D0
MNIEQSEKLLKMVGGVVPSARSKISAAIMESTAAMDARSASSDAAREDFRLFSEGERQLFRRFSVEKSTGTDGRPAYTPVEDRGRDVAETTRIAHAARLVLDRWEIWQHRKAAAERASAETEKWTFLSELSQWLADNRGTKFKPVKPPAATLTKGQHHQDAIHELRARIDDIEARSAAMESAPAPVDDLIGRMNAAIDANAARNEPAMYFSKRFGSPVNVGEATDHASSDVHRLAFEAWALSDILKAEAAKKIRAAHPGGGVSDFERAAELSALAADKLALERLEEAHIIAAAEVGQVIGRRRDADPRAILEIE